MSEGILFQDHHASRARALCNANLSGVTVPLLAWRKQMSLWRKRSQGLWQRLRWKKAGLETNPDDAALVPFLEDLDSAVTHSSSGDGAQHCQEDEEDAALVPFLASIAAGVQAGEAGDTGVTEPVSETAPAPAPAAPALERRKRQRIDWQLVRITVCSRFCCVSSCFCAFVWRFVPKWNSLMLSIRIAKAARPPTPRGVKEALDQLGHRGRTDARDAWVFRFLAAAPDLKAKFSDGKVAKAALRKYWASSTSDMQRRAWYKHCVAPAACSQPAFPSTEVVLTWWRQHSDGTCRSSPAAILETMLVALCQQMDRREALVCMATC